jgi:hypothetical protein
MVLTFWKKINIWPAPGFEIRTVEFEDGRIILKRILRNTMEWSGLDSPSSEQGQAVANMLLIFGHLKFGEFLDWLKKF